MTKKPLNVLLIMTDQQRADFCAREGYAVDTTPFEDALAESGVWFNKAYTSAPLCLPARVTLMTGRYPSAAHAKTNYNANDVFYTKDLFDVMRENGYYTALFGKNHSHVTQEKADVWEEYTHTGPKNTDSEQQRAFNDCLTAARYHKLTMTATPYPAQAQNPYQIVSKATQWMDGIDEKRPFFAWVSFPEPHNPYQVSEPYFSMFTPENIPVNKTTAKDLPKKGFKFQWNYQGFTSAFVNYDEGFDRTRANYHGMLRLIDDQVKRLVEYIRDRGWLDNTLIVYTSDHGDFVGEYGLIRKGPEVPEVLCRIPMIFAGAGLHGGLCKDRFVSIADVMPTLCEAIGAPIPEGVQGRSLWPLLHGEPVSEKEFETAYVEQGFGGLHYDGTEDFDPQQDGFKPGWTYDCLNSRTQSGVMRMVRRGDWKLVLDMQQKGQLYNLADDPYELNNLYGDERYLKIQMQLLEDMNGWQMRTMDSLPETGMRYRIKKAEHNYWFSNET